MSSVLSALTLGDRFSSDSRRSRSSLFSLERQRARFASERLDQREEDLESSSASSPAAAAVVSTTERTANSQDDTAVPSAASTTVTTSTITTSTSTTTTTANLSEESNNVDMEEVPLSRSSEREGRGTDVEQGEGGDDDDDVVVVVAEEGTAQGRTVATTATRERSANTMTLAELEEERELARRRSSFCVLVGVFVLFRLWMISIQNGDFILLMLCLMATSWTARWIRYNREQEEELDRRIANYQNENATNEIDRNDLRMLSFQAQLALAIMESQRQMMEGGHGHPDGAHVSQGVTEETRANWKRIPFQPDTAAAASAAANSKLGYGSVGQEDSTPSKTLEEAPHCSICLGEYEAGESLVQLPCGHVYHADCIDSWTANHRKCPLCNYDLEATPDENNASGQTIEIV